MEHNKFKFELGDTVMLDEKYNNKIEVRILNFTTNQLFATVLPIHGSYEPHQVMTTRLSPELRSSKTRSVSGEARLLMLRASNRFPLHQISMPLSLPVPSHTFCSLGVRNTDAR